MKYCELTILEKAELRSDLFSMYCNECEDFDCLPGEIKTAVSRCERAEDIPENIMGAVYGGYSFVKEDFFCNI